MTPAERAKQIVDENTAAGSARLDRLVDAIAAAITVPANHVRDEHGNDMRVLGTLPKTADGCVVGCDVDEMMWDKHEIGINVITADSEYSGRLYSTRSAALAAKNGGAT